MKEKKPLLRYSEIAPTAERCVDGDGLCTPEVPSVNGRTFYRVKILKMGKVILSEAEWNRVFMPLHPCGCRGFFYGGNYERFD